MTAPEDTSKLRKALAVLAGLSVLLVTVVVLSRCSSPSTINTGESARAGYDALNAAAAGQAAVVQWAGEPADVVRVRWLDPDTAVTTARLDSGEHVTVTAVRAPDGWVVIAPPSPTTAEPETAWPGLSAENLVLARDDQRWRVAKGFLAAWLARQPTERWTAVGYDAPVLSVRYDSWEVTGLGMPLEVPGTSIEVVPVDFEARTDDTTRTYRVYLAVVEDSTGRWTVNAVGHRPPA